MFKLILLLIIFISGISFAQHENHKSTKSEITKAIAVLTPTKESKVKGTITFTKQNDGIKIIADIEGLTPGKHGMHIHEFGDCNAPDATSAGGHFNPASKPHSAFENKERHAGDLENINADANGKAHLELFDRTMKFDGDKSILGRAVIVHEKEDDLKTQPTGNAGGTVACGVIGVAK